MSSSEAERVMAALTQALTEFDWDALGRAYHADGILEYPQSGEVFRGLANIRGQFENYPDLDPGGSELAEVISDDSFALAPSYTVIRVEGTGNRGTAIVRVRYPDDSWWWAVNLFELRDGLITRSRVYFAPDFPAPDWRAPYRDSP